MKAGAHTVPIHETCYKLEQKKNSGKNYFQNVSNIKSASDDVRNNLNCQPGLHTVYFYIESI